MRRKLPPFPALRAFEASARHLSFKNAAAELCLTQSAIAPIKLGVLSRRTAVLSETRAVVLTAKTQVTGLNRAILTQRRKARTEA